MAACTSELGGYSTENPDQFCKNLLENGEPKELREWLYGTDNTLGELQTNDASIAFVASAYASGAKNVYAVEIEKHPKYGENSSHLVVELPESRSDRSALLKWAAPIAHKLGFDAYTDVGQRYIYLMLD